MSLSCGTTINGLAVKAGTLYTWGKGDHEKPKFDDYIEYSTPFPMIEDKQIVYISCGASHVMALDRNGRLYGWGHGTEGCLGFGDGKKRLSVCPISFFENKRVIDVACGDKFTVVIAENFPDRKTQINLDIFNRSGAIDVSNGLMSKLQKIKGTIEGVKSPRKPLCGGDNVSEQLRLRIQEVL